MEGFQTHGCLSYNRMDVCTAQRRLLIATPKNDRWQIHALQQEQQASCGVWAIRQPQQQGTTCVVSQRSLHAPCIIDYFVNEQLGVMETCYRSSKLQETHPKGVEYIPKLCKLYSSTCQDKRQCGPACRRLLVPGGCHQWFAVLTGVRVARMAQTHWHAGGFGSCPVPVPLAAGGKEELLWKL